MKPVRPKTPKKPMGKLKNSVKDPIEVYCRIRSLNDENVPVCIRAKDNKTVIVCPVDVSEESRIKEIHYSFKKVFDTATTQKEIFDHVCLPLVQDVLLGSNGLLFTYGITSSGKTYTMTGYPQDGGLLPRSLDVIFNSIKDVQAKKYVFKPNKQNSFDIQSPADALEEQQRQLGIFTRNKIKNKREMIGDWCSRVSDTTVIENIVPDMNFAVFISYVEIYNNYIYDLLEEYPLDTKKKGRLLSKPLREDHFQRVYISGAAEIEVETVEEALQLFYKGQQRRKVSETALNAESSRSHSVFTIRVVQAPLDPTGAEVLQDSGVTISQLSLVDLAGSERCSRTKNTGHILKEAGNINSSLMILRNCIEALRDSQSTGITKMIPYRETKLTHLFKIFFEGEGKIKMIVCVNPQADYYEETLHVMRFAEMTQDVLISRPTPVSTPNVLGLKSGRGNLYKNALKRAKEQGVPISEVLSPTVYSLGPDFPQLTIEFSDDETPYINLIDYLASRIIRRNALTQDLSRRQEEFRKNLIAVDKEIIQLKQEKGILQMDLNAREQQVRGLEQKLSSAEETVDVLQRQVGEYRRQAENATIEVSEKERELTDQTKEVERMKAKMQEKLAYEKDRLRRIMEARLAAKQAVLERKMCLTDEKFRQLREILNDDDWDCIGDFNIPLPSIPSTATSESSSPVTRVKQRINAFENVGSSAETRITKSRSATDFVHGNNGPNVQFSNQSSKNNAESVFYKESQPPNSSQCTRGIAVANPRHRRSTSTGDVWIEHKPIGNLELNTVLQPAMKKKKSVSKLEVKDVTKSDVSKYVLQHQEQDSQGEVETQLFKADIIPSAGGGAQVIFNDVEKLRQVSPPPVYNLRKRSGENLPLREVEDRCTVSMECHGLPSKMMRKK